MIDCTRRPAALSLLSLALLAAAACTRNNSAPTEHADEGKLASTVRAADPGAALQLASGFYAVEGNAWRWTAGRFSVILKAAPGAAQKGATLVLKLAVPDAVIHQIGPVTLSATAGGVSLAPQEYAQAGNQIYTRPVPAQALTADTVTVDFSLDKHLSPTPNDRRELGVIVSSVGLEAVP